LRAAEWSVIHTDSMNVKTPAVARTKKAEQSEVTQAALLRGARDLFTERGYAGTATEEIVLRAGVTRGALYHQFRDKEDLFRAVYAQIEAEFTEKIAARIRERTRHGANAWEEFREGAQAYLDVALDPDVQRIALLDAPSVMRASAGREVGRFGLALLHRGLQRCIDQGYIEPQPVEPLAHLLRAALTEAAMLIARSPDHASMRREAGAAVERLLVGMERKRG
jgi:AcrR family transcriptional regulator